jgi:hypothetical protein
MVLAITHPSNNGPANIEIQQMLKIAKSEPSRGTRQ